MTVYVDQVVCPHCGGPCEQLNAQPSDEGCFTAWWQEEWRCISCGKKFIIGCERRMCYYCYVEEDGSYSEDHEIVWEREE